MALSEFSLIERFFSHPDIVRDDVLIGVGDDGAQLRVPSDQTLVVSIDTMVAGVHFFPDVDPADLGYKLLAVNLSDLAAMGADPAWMTLALTLPQADESWLQGFAQGLSQLANGHRVQLVGGDTTRGPLVLTLQAHGFVPAQCIVTRAGARPGDRIYVTGTLGDAGLALRIMRGEPRAAVVAVDFLRQRLLRPSPRVEVGRALRGIASAAIDISDGLIADLGHILKRSRVGAQLRLEALPLSDAYTTVFMNGLDYVSALSGGDDYELCFTAPAHQHERIQAIAGECACPITCIGEIVEEGGLSITLHGEPYQPSSPGYDHFANG